MPTSFSNEQLHIWPLLWIIEHYQLSKYDIATEMGVTTRWVNRILSGKAPSQSVMKLDKAVYHLTKDVVCCKAHAEYKRMMNEQG